MDIGKEKFGFLNQKPQQGFAAYFSGVNVIVKQRGDLEGISSQNAPTARSTPVPVVTDQTVAGLRLCL